MVPASPPAPQHDADFDLDVRLQRVQHRIADGDQPTKAGCTQLHCTVEGCATVESGCQSLRRD